MRDVVIVGGGVMGVEERIQELLGPTLRRLTQGLPKQELQLIEKEAMECEYALWNEIQLIEQQLSPETTTTIEKDILSQVELWNPKWKKQPSLQQQPLLKKQKLNPTTTTTPTTTGTHNTSTHSNKNKNDTPASSTNNNHNNKRLQSVNFGL